MKDAIWGAPGLTSNKKLLGTTGTATRSKDAVTTWSIFAGVLFEFGRKGNKREPALLSVFSVSW